MRKTLAALSLAAGIAASPASFAAITYDLNIEFSGGTTPSGSVLATFETWAANTVRLTIDLTDLTTSSEFVRTMWFNYLPGPALPLTFSLVSGDGTTSILQAQDTTNAAHRPDGDGFFDIVMNFANSGAARLQAGETSVFDIMGTGLTESAFAAESFGGNKGSFFAAAHVQGVGDGSLSGFVGAIPEPETYAMLLAGLGLLGFLARRRQRSLRLAA